MKTIFYTNNSEHVKHLGGKMIRPGETREVAEIDHPDYSPAAPEAPTPDAAERQAVRDILEHNVPEIEAMLGQLSDRELSLLEAAEQADERPRKTLLEAFEEERLRRAADVTTSDPDMDAFAAMIADMDAAELEAQISLHEGSPAHLTAIEAEQARREAGAG
jgi:hypothetical protein